MCNIILCLNFLLFANFFVLESLCNNIFIHIECTHCICKKKIGISPILTVVANIHYTYQLLFSLIPFLGVQLSD